MKADKKSVWGIVAAAVGGAVLTVVFNQLASGGIATAQRALTPTAEVEAQLERWAANDPMFSALAKNFPTEWATMRGEMGADMKSGKSEGELNARAHARSRAFMLERLSAAASAPTAALTSVITTDADLVSRLQRENIQYCADFGTRGLQPGIELSPATMQKVMISGGNRIIAIRQGLDSPQRRGRATDDDYAALLDRMLANGTSDATLGAFENTATASPEMLCEGTVQIYRAMTELPPEQGARIFSEVTLAPANAASGPTP